MQKKGKTSFYICIKCYKYYSFVWNCGLNDKSEVSKTKSQSETLYPSVETRLSGAAGPGQHIWVSGSTLL